MESQAFSGLNDRRFINNAFYDSLGEKWYHASDDPVALLRAEAKLRNAWIADYIERQLGQESFVLDIGCGGGFLSNALASCGHKVTGVDLSEESLAVARHYDSTHSVRYMHGDAYALPFEDKSFDVVAAMDFLEHVLEPERVVREAARVLKPGGLFFFHTFNRNALSWFIVIKGVEWFVKNTPKDLHVYRFFIKPKELVGMCKRAGLDLKELKGCAPKVFTKAFWKLLTTREVPHDFEFHFTRSKLMGYTGVVEKPVTLELL